MGEHSTDRRRLNRRTVIKGAVAVAGTLALPLGSLAGESAPEATTAYGRIRGYNDGPVKVFKGVPYGAPTGGENRWLPPKAPLAWTGVRDTTAPGAMAPQDRHGAPLPEEQAMSQTDPQSEDCLNLNVTTPAVGAHSGKRPVIVWFHGGGFSMGSGNATSYDGRNLVHKQDVVLVTVTHRLNVLGFLYLADLYGPAYADSGNLGMLDCVAALEWVRDNIAQFGGDPHNVTIAGQSGGGAKVSTLMGMPAAKGLFARAIAESGAYLRAPTADAAAAAAKRFVTALGVTSLAELQAAPAEQLVAVMNQLHIMSSPVVDGRSLPRAPFAPDASPLSRDIPFLLGTNETESTFFPMTPLDAIDDAKLHALAKGSVHGTDADADRLLAVFREAYPGKDNSYLFELLASQVSQTQEGVITEAERKAEQKGAPVYLYYFLKHTPVHEGKLKAVHTLEIPFVFDSLNHSQPIVGSVTADQQALADKMSATWASFARTGNPNNPKIPKWPPFDTERRAIMQIDDQWKVIDDPLHAQRLVIAEVKAHTPPMPEGPPPDAPPPGAPPPGARPPGPQP